MSFDYIDNKKNVNDEYIKVLGLLLLFPVIIQFLHTFMSQIGITDVSKVTIALYIAVLLYIIIRFIKDIYIFDMFRLILFYLPFIVNYFVFAETRDNMTEQSMMLLYLFFLPLCCFTIIKIRNWQNFNAVLRPYALVGIIAGLILILFLDFEEHLVYMEFSYALLPLLAIIYGCWRYGKGDRNVNIILFVIGTVQILIFGARAPILFLVIYICLFEIFNPRVKNSTKIIVAFLGLPIIFTVYLWAPAFFEFMGNLSIFENSRVFKTLLSGDFLESNTRDFIYRMCRNRLESMGMSVTGFFGDRKYCGSIYPHNFVYEILMSYGWILGIIAIATLVFLALKAYFRNRENRVIVIFFIMTLFCRYTISGTYIVEGKFWIFLFAIIALSLSEKDNITSKSITDNSNSV